MDQEQPPKPETLQLVGGLWKDPRGPYITYVKREFWGAKPPTAPPRPLATPIKYIRFCYTGTPMHFYHYAYPELRELQQDQMMLEGLPDIAYNFLVGADGILYEGRGWKAEADRPPEFAALNGKPCLDVAYIGDFRDQVQTPPWLMVNTGMDLIKYGIRSKLIDPLFEVIQYNELGFELNDQKELTNY